MGETLKITCPIHMAFRETTARHCFFKSAAISPHENQRLGLGIVQPDRFPQESWLYSWCGGE
jgi:hypothetical protein